jgi:hypothetical protein
MEFVNEVAIFFGYIFNFSRVASKDALNLSGLKDRKCDFLCFKR